MAFGRLLGYDKDKHFIWIIHGEKNSKMILEELKVMVKKLMKVYYNN